MNSDDIKQQIEELEKIQRQTRRFRLCALLGILAIVISGVSAIINCLYGLGNAGPRQDAFFKELGRDVPRNVYPVVQKIAATSVQNLKPALEVEFQRLNVQAPRVADAALSEANKMIGDLPVRAEKSLDTTLVKVLKERDGKLRKMYPGLYDKQFASLLDNMSLEAQDQVARATETIFKPHLDSVQSILENLNRIQATERIDPKVQIAPWQMAFIFLHVFDQEFKDLACVPTLCTKETK